jgi:hypothetical protein
MVDVSILWWYALAGVFRSRGLAHSTIVGGVVEGTMSRSINVCLWPFADLHLSTRYVGFREKGGLPSDIARPTRMTQSGHLKKYRLEYC